MNYTIRKPPENESIVTLNITDKFDGSDVQVTLEIKVFEFLKVLIDEIGIDEISDFLIIYKKLAPLFS